MCTMQGCVRRKTVLKEGRKPTVASWQRYWLQIWATSLVYFSPKSFKGHRRSDFKREPCKLVPIVGCQVVMGENALHPDSFQIVDHLRGGFWVELMDLPDLKVFRFRERVQISGWHKIIGRKMVPVPSTGRKRRTSSTTKQSHVIWIKFVFMIYVFIYVYCFCIFAFIIISLFIVSHCFVYYPCPYYMTFLN